MAGEGFRGSPAADLPDLGEAPPWQVSRWFNTAEPPSLPALRGKVVLMHAFQMLCPGCVSHGVPQAERVHRRFGGHGVVVVGFHTVFEHHEAMTPVALAAFLHEYRVTHPVAVDLPVAGQPLPATMAAYDMQGTPTTILLDRDGRIRLQALGGVDDLQLGLQLGRLLGR
jgi:thiol-disulfide isomerase/thioredoxin